MNHEFERESNILTELIRTAYHHNIPLLGTNDAHYATKGDSILHDSMLCLQTRKRLSDTDRMRFDGSGYHLRSREELRYLLPKEALDNTLLVAEMVEPYVFDTEDKWPVPVSTHDAFGKPESKLKFLCRESLGHGMGSEYADRLERELEVLCSKGFASYMLVCAELSQLAKTNSILLGPGRGSAAGSLVSYLLGITQIDPIEHGLLFERFLNPERVSKPDVDSDIADRDRDRFLDLVRKTYGEDRCAQFATFATIKGPRAVLDSSFVLGYSQAEGREFRNRLPDPQFGRQASFAEIDLPSSGIPTDVLSIACGLEDMARNASTHASAFIISPEPLLGNIPLWNPSGKGALTTQWDMHAIEELGYVKLDFLGLGTLSIIQDACTSIGISTDDLPRTIADADDDPTWYLLSRGETVSVFQLESTGMSRLLKSIRPRSISQLAIVGALYRPGPMGMGAHTEYAQRASAPGRPVKQIHPSIDGILYPIVEETFGLFVYQEQIMAALQAVAGYSLGDADVVRKIMGKKDRNLLKQEEERYFARTRERGIPQDGAQLLWDTMVPFADYAFGRAHAYSYAYISYWAAYLKANHPKEWMAAVLTAQEDSTYIAEAKRIGITILPPSVNESSESWTAVEKGLRYGLGTIKGVGAPTVTKIKSLAPFKSWTDFLHRIPATMLRTNTLRALLQAGAMDEFGSREGLLEALDQHVINMHIERDDRKAGRQRFRPLDYTINHRQIDYEARRAMEQEVLGVSISTPPLSVELPLSMTPKDWEYVWNVVRNYPGTSALQLHCGNWTIEEEGVDDIKVARSLKPLMDRS